MVDAEQLTDLDAARLREVTLRLIRAFAEQQRQLEAKDGSIGTLRRQIVGAG